MTVNSISADENWTYCRYVDEYGTERRIKSQFFVGADGKVGFTRKKYLEKRGILMEKANK